MVVKLEYRSTDKENEMLEIKCLDRIVNEEVLDRIIKIFYEQLTPSVSGVAGSYFGG